MSPLSYLILVTLTLYLFNNDYYVSGYHCVVIEDDIPSPFTDKNCIQKVQLLLDRTTPFSLEIATSNNKLLSNIKAIINKENGYNNYIGNFKNEGVMYRAVKSFTSQGLKQGATATLTTALGYCAWNIVDNFSFEKLSKPMILIYDILSCNNINWKDVISQSIVWGSASGVVKGGLEAYQEIKIIKWTYYSPKQTDSYSTITIKQET